MNSEKSFKTIPVQARFAVIFFSLAGLLAVFGSMFFTRQSPISQTLLLVVIGVVMARAKVKLAGTSTISLLTTTVLLALMMGGTAMAVIVGICGVTAQTLLPSRKIVLHQLAFNIGMIALTVCATGWAVHMLIRGSVLDQLLIAPVASLVYFFGNSSSIALIIGLSKRVSALEIWRTHMVSTAPSFLIAGTLSLTLFHLVASPATGLALAVVPMISSIYYVSVWLAGRTPSGSVNA